MIVPERGLPGPYVDEERRTRVYPPGTLLRGCRRCWFVAEFCRCGLDAEFADIEPANLIVPGRRIETVTDPDGLLTDPATVNRETAHLSRNPDFRFTLARHRYDLDGNRFEAFP